MTATAAPFGLRPSFHASAYGTRGATRYEAAQVSGYATSIYENSPVALATTGLVTAVAAAADYLGSFQGCEFTDSTGRFRVSNYWPGGQAILTGSSINFYVNDDPNLVYEVQGVGSSAQTVLGDSADCTAGTFTTGSTVTGISSMSFDSANLKGAASPGMMQAIGLAQYVDNAWGDSYTILKVRVSRHQFVAAKNSF